MADTVSWLALILAIIAILIIIIIAVIFSQRQNLLNIRGINFRPINGVTTGDEVLPTDDNYMYLSNNTANMNLTISPSNVGLSGRVIGVCNKIGSTVSSSNCAVGSTGPIITLKPGTGVKIDDDGHTLQVLPGITAYIMSLNNTNTSFIRLS